MQSFRKVYSIKLDKCQAVTWVQGNNTCRTIFRVVLSKVYCKFIKLIYRISTLLLVACEASWVNNLLFLLDHGTTTKTFHDVRISIAWARQLCRSNMGCSASCILSYHGFSKLQKLGLCVLGRKLYTRKSRRLHASLTVKWRHGRQPQSEKVKLLYRYITISNSYEQ